MTEEQDKNIQKESFLRDFLIRQREIHNKSLAMVSNIAQSNIELIMLSGINEIAAKRAKRIKEEIVGETTRPQQE